MPGVDGPELAAAVGRAYPQVRVLYMSGYAGEAMRHRGVLPAGAPLVQKPFSAQTLATRVREALDG
jgi:FixJ family two-component response regulator